MAYDINTLMFLSLSLNHWNAVNTFAAALIPINKPYLLAKYSVNSKSNHQNIGVVKQSNLCAEIVQYTDEDTTAICTLSSMVLKNFIRDGKFDFKLLHDETRKVVRALNKVVDINNYSTEMGKKGGM